MEARMTNPARILPELGGAVGTMMGAIHSAGVPESTLEFVHLRISQINGCAFCVDMAARSLRKGGEPDDRLAGLAVWREGPWFSEAERAALGLAEAATRLADRPDPVPDAVWDEAARHYDEEALAGLLTQIAVTNFFNRVNVSIRQPPGAW